MDLKFIRSHPDQVRRTIREKGGDVDLDEILHIDRERRALIEEIETLRRTRAESGKAPADRQISDRMKDLEAQRRETERRLKEKLLDVPNPPDPSVPAESREIRRCRYMFIKQKRAAAMCAARALNISKA